MGLLILGSVVIDIAFALFVLWVMGKFARNDAFHNRLFRDITERFAEDTKTLNAHSDDLQGAYTTTTQHDETIAALQESVLQIIERVNVISETQDISNASLAEVQAMLKNILAMPAPASKKEVDELKKGLQPEAKKEAAISRKKVISGR